jgi:hypothetical protein
MSLTEEEMTNNLRRVQGYLYNFKEREDKLKYLRAFRDALEEYTYIEDYRSCYTDGYDTTQIKQYQIRDKISKFFNNMLMLGKDKVNFCISKFVLKMSPTQSDLTRNVKNFMKIKNMFSDEIVHYIKGIINNINKNSSSRSKIITEDDEVVFGIGSDDIGPDDIGPDDSPTLNEFPPNVLDAPNVPPADSKKTTTKKVFSFFGKGGKKTKRKRTKSKRKYA